MFGTHLCIKYLPDLISIHQNTTCCSKDFSSFNGWLGVLRQKKLESDQGIFVSDLNNGRNKSYDKVQNMPRKVRVHAVPMFVRISVMIYL